APFFPPGEKVAISAPLKGTADSVTAELFAWDDSLETNRISVKEVSGNPAVLELAGLAEGVYLARFTAQTGDAKSVQWVRFAVEGKQGKIVHMGISSFPSQGQTTLHICLSNAPARSPGGASFIGNGEVVITDMDNNVLAAESFAGIDITPEPVGLAAAVSLPGQTKFRIAAVLKDSAGKVHDVAELDYDLSRFAGLERELSVVVPPTVSPGGPLAYTIAYFDGAGNPLAAKFYVTLEDASGQVVRLSEADVSGTAEQTLDIAGLANGQYTLKAVDGASSLADSVAFEVGDQPQAGQDAGWLLPIVAVAIIAAMALYILRRRQGL
ncbi:MAG: hypothetical protein HY519_01765, partial [Candidatus Aenigmarchaeota archaeon]|nr:hypothetical protein [Candidatus Aenigmarchaeota archaeon]